MPTNEAQPEQQPRFEPRPRRYGLIFRRYSWQVWDNQLNDWSRQALCGGAIIAAQAAADGLNRAHSGGGFLAEVAGQDRPHGVDEAGETGGATRDG